MRITLSDLTVNVDHLDQERLLEDWRWLIGPSKRLVLVSAIGDAFLRDEDDGTIHLLDTAAGSCALAARDANEFRSLLTDRDWVTDHLAALVIADFLRNDLRLERAQIYSWKRPPVLGGEYELANAEASDIAAHFSLTGQIHPTGPEPACRDPDHRGQVPPGTGLSRLPASHQRRGTRLLLLRGSSKWPLVTSPDRCP